MDEIARPPASASEDPPAGAAARSDHAASPRIVDGTGPRIDPRAVARNVWRAMRRPATYPGYLKEAMWTGVNVAFYPVGLLSDALRMTDDVRLGDRFSPQVPLAYLDPEAAATPVVLLHGYFHNRSAFVVMRRRLKRYGFRNVTPMNYNVIGHDIPELAEQLYAFVERVCEQAGAHKVHLVGHSLGGIVARYYIQALGGEDRVRTCITLGSPHQGTYAAIVGRGRAARQLRPGSPILEQLRATARPMPVRFVSYYSNLDGMVLPPGHAKLDCPPLRARNVLVKDLGHMSLLASRPLLHSIAATLSRPDAPGRRAA